MNPRLLRRLGVLGLTVLVFVAVLGLGVVPFRGWLDQLAYPVVSNHNLTTVQLYACHSMYHIDHQ